ncbi:MAG: LysM peptidoglycan-binding domain-containing protein [Thermodesulfobacteriota bacterium]|nr:LysM peptidoglycan-binding domain-containing protein [Thermodesulfobacteriota bacterium]
MKKFFISVFCLLILLYSVGFSKCLADVLNVLEKEMDYTVVKDDTLWDISEKFYKDPFLWPWLWKKNQYIENPHLIYPGNRIHLYPYTILIPEEESRLSPIPSKPGAPLPEPPSKIDLTSYPKAFFAGFIVDDIDAIGTIMKEREGKNLLGSGDIVFLRFQDNIKVSNNDQFTIFRVEGPVVHPMTEIVIGKKVNILGIVQVDQIENQIIRAEIIRSSGPVEKGDLLSTYMPPYHELFITKFEKPMYGWIIDSKGKHSDLAEGDIVYIDSGAYSGIKPGNIFNILRRGKWVVDPLSDKKVKLPDDPIGRLVIIAAQSKTATALIVNSKMPIYIGDELVGIVD